MQQIAQNFFLNKTVWDDWNEEKQKIATVFFFADVCKEQCSLLTWYPEKNLNWFSVSVVYGPLVNTYEICYKTLKVHKQRVS